MQKATTKPLPTPAAPRNLHPDVVLAGPLIPALERIRLFSSLQWEEFVEEWADSLRLDYKRVERCGSAGDMGRDIIATGHGNEDDWDNFQCKHYDHPLRPTDIWVELGKLVYYTHGGAYTYPRRYYFIAPRGAGTKLLGLLKNTARLRSELVDNWDVYCRHEITSTQAVVLDGALKAYTESLDFSIFEAVPPLRIIDQHAQTRWHVARFGGGLPERPAVDAPPDEPAVHEARYVRQLLDAYADHLKRSIATPSDIAKEALSSHFNDSRLEFYSAEALRTFSRDTLPPGEFEKLQDEVQSGIMDEVRAEHSDGYRRVIAVVKMAKSLQITAHSLISRLHLRDRGGICHQLTNDDKFRWTR